MGFSWVLDHLSDRLVAEFRAFSNAHQGRSINLARLVQQLWKVYGAREYWAIWEIIIGTRADSLLHEQIIEHRARTIRSFLQVWDDMNGGTIKLNKRAVEAFELMLTSIRGLCLERFIKDDEEFFRTQLKLLARVISPELLPLVNTNI